tara:strand:- start:53 stop:499 length:447 start_codon:yes stop_codon:yes gene_type:complete
MTEVYKKRGEMVSIPKDIAPAFNKMFDRVLSTNPNIMEESPFANPLFLREQMADQFVDSFVDNTDPRNIEESMTYQMLLQLRGSDVADEYLRAMQQKKMLEDLKKAQDFVGPPNLGSELKARASEKKLRLPKTELPEGYGTGGRISLI